MKWSHQKILKMYMKLIVITSRVENELQLQAQYYLEKNLETQILQMIKTVVSWD